MMSRITASYAFSCARCRPSGPVWARSTVKPSAVKPRCNADARRISSSTMSKRTVPPSGRRCSLRLTRDPFGPCAAPCQTAIRKLGRGPNASALSQWEPPILDPVTAPPILQRHPALRWLAPIGIACVAGLAATGFFDSSASPSTGSLPATTPAALIAAVRQPQVDGFSGTVVTHLSLGLPELPNVAGADSTSFTSLLSGAHTMQVWYGGVSRQRVALLGSTDEADVFRDGRELWQWSSDDRSAVHAVLPSGSAVSGPVGAVTDLTPLDLARQLLAAMESSTHVAVDQNHQVADRSAYDLVLTP